MSAMIDQKIIPMPKAAVPMAEASERAAISCLLQNFACLDAMAWPEDLFFQHSHRVILKTIRELHEDGVTTDYYAVHSKLERDGLLEEVGGENGLMDLSLIHI